MHIGYKKVLINIYYQISKKYQTDLKKLEYNNNMAINSQQAILNR